MGRELFTDPTPIMEEKFDNIVFSESSSVSQGGHGQRSHLNGYNDAQMEIQQSRVPSRGAYQQFQDEFTQLYGPTDARKNTVAQYPAGELQSQRGTVMRYSERPRSRHGRRAENTQPQISMGDTIPEPAIFVPKAAGVVQDHSGKGYVERQREAQQIHSKAHLGEIGSPLDKLMALSGTYMDANDGLTGNYDLYQPGRPSNHIQQMILRKRQGEAKDLLKISTDPVLKHKKCLKTKPKWPFIYKNESSQDEDNEGTPFEAFASGWAKECLMLERQESLHLRKPHKNNGKMAQSSSPSDKSPPQPPQHVYGLSIKPGKTDKMFQLPFMPTLGLQRRNAQRMARRGSDSPDTAPKHIESDANRGDARICRGKARKNVKLVYPSPVELARRKGTLPQIVEVVEEEAESDYCGHTLASTSPDEVQGEHLMPETPELGSDDENLIEDHQEQADMGEQKSEKNFQRFALTPGGQDASPGKNTSREDGHNETHNGNGHAAPQQRRFPLVVKTARQDPVVPSLPPMTPVSTAPTQVSPPAAAPETDASARDAFHCGTSGCTMTDCLRIRGKLGMAAPGAASDRNSGGGSILGEEKDENDIVSAGHGFAFLRLN